MKKKIYYLASCSTCQRIMKEVGVDASFEQQNIKEQAITPAQLEEMHQLAGSYEALFSRRSLKFREWSLHEKELTESDYRDLILKEYTFLKRPVFLIGKQIYIGNTKQVVEAVKQALA
ncbi:arsenate reductase [soil metagenome]